MVAYNFKSQFSTQVEDGTKKQTIRQRGKKKPPNVGDELQLYTGMRTKNCRLLRRSKCTSVEVIEILSLFIAVLIGTPSGDTYYYIRLTDSAMEKYAKDDGFESVDAFFNFFDSNGGGFSGFLIRWQA